MASRSTLSWAKEDTPTPAADKREADEEERGPDAVDEGAVGSVADDEDEEDEDEDLDGGAGG